MKQSEHTLCLASQSLRFTITAGFPLTDAVLSTSYTVLTAHAPDKVEWSKYSQLDTLVLLMAASNLRVIMQHLLNTAWPSDTPVSMYPVLQKAHCGQSSRLGCAVWSCLTTYDGICMSPQLNIPCISGGCDQVGWDRAAADVALQH